MRNGEAIPPKFIFQALRAKIQTEEVVFKGYVLDGVPGNLDEPDVESQTSPRDIQVLTEILSQKAPNHVQILVNLSMSDEDLMCRKAAQWLDPKTNSVYCGQQISYSRQRRAAGWVDGSEDEVATAESKWFADQKSKAMEDDGADDELQEQREELGDTEAEKPVVSAQEPSKLRSRTAWPILSDEVLAR